MLILCSHDKDQIARWRAGLGGYRGRYRVCESLEDLASDGRIGPDDLVLLDVELCRRDSACILGFIARHPALRVFAFSSLHQPEEGAAVIAAGARGYANRYMHPEVLSQAVPLVEGGEVWLGADLVLHLIKQNSPLNGHPVLAQDQSTEGILGKLTPRERDIAYRVVQGKSNKIIARELGVTERTVKAHLGSVFKKTETRDRLQLAMLLKDQV